MYESAERSYSPRGILLFGRYARAYFRRHFTALRVSRSGPVPPSLTNTILYTNHPSWWDPMIMLMLAAGPFSNYRMFAPIDAASLERYPILKRFGLFPLETGSLGGHRRFLETTGQLLESPDNVLAITAQGRYSDPRERPLNLRGGVAHLLEAYPERVAIPVSLEYTYWNGRLPEALVHFGKPVRAEPGASIARTNHRLDAALCEALDALAARAIERDPDRFDILVGRDRTDVDGIYGLIRRLLSRSKSDRSSAPNPDAVDR
jgi:1-acyl-sn-glycerol-3-phosphate acyltransferase